MDNGDNRDRLQLADDDDNDSPALAGGSIPRYRALAARNSYMSQDRPDLKFALMQVCCAMARPTMRDMERVDRRIRATMVPRWEAERRGAGSVGSRVASWKRIRTLIGEATEPTRQAGLRWSHHEQQRPLP